MKSALSRSEVTEPGMSRAVNSFTCLRERLLFEPWTRSRIFDIISPCTCVRTWLSQVELQCGVNDFVACFYPKSFKAEIYLAHVECVDAERITLQHWPANDSEPHKGHPYYRKPEGGTRSRTEARRFWRLIHRVDPPQAVDAHDGVYKLSSAAFQTVHILGKQFALT